jgi:G3E family GTPase
MDGLGAFSREDHDRRFAVQGVHMLVEGGSQRSWKTKEVHRTRLACIGRGLPKELLRQGFEACHV